MDSASGSWSIGCGFESYQRHTTIIAPVLQRLISPKTRSEKSQFRVSHRVCRLQTAVSSGDFPNKSLYSVYEKEKVAIFSLLLLNIRA